MTAPLRYLPAFPSSTGAPELKVVMSPLGVITAVPRASQEASFCEACAVQLPTCPALAFLLERIGPLHAGLLAEMYFRAGCFGELSALLLSDPLVVEHLLDIDPLHSFLPGQVSAVQGFVRSLFTRRAAKSALDDINSSD